MDPLSEKERAELNKLIASLLQKLPFTAPEMLSERVANYVETAWMRGRSAGIEEMTGKDQ
jgi:hypothetical protein